jgi:hypothetical protein
MRSKTFMELEKYYSLYFSYPFYSLEKDYNKLELEKDQYKKAFFEKDRECEDLRKEIFHLKNNSSPQNYNDKRLNTNTSSSGRTPMTPRERNLLAQNVFDSLNDSAMSDLRNELDSARKLPSSCD